MKMSKSEVVANVTLSVEEIADERPKANLFGHKVRRPDIREKNNSLCVRSPNTLHFFDNELDITCTKERSYRGYVVSSSILQGVFRVAFDGAAGLVVVSSSILQGVFRTTPLSSAGLAVVSSSILQGVFRERFLLTYLD